MHPCVPLSSVTTCLLAALSLAVASCDTPKGQNPGVGAAAGAPIGGLADNRVSGASGGAVSGAVSGELVGLIVQPSDAEAYGPMPRGGYPTAAPGPKKGLVKSPFAPHYVINVEGAHHGSLVRDPSCNRLFVNP